MKNLTKTTLLLCMLLFCASAGFSQDTARMRQLIDEGVTLHDGGKYNEAIEKYKAALQIDPKNARAKYEMSYTLYTSGRPDEAIPILEKFTAGDGYPGAFDLLGSIYDDKKDYAKAVESYKQGISAFPDYQRLHFNLGISYLRQAKYAEAEQAGIKAIQLNPRHASSHRLYALATYGQKKKVPSIMAFCTFLMLESQTKRSGEAYSYMQKIFQSTVTQDSAKNGKQGMTIHLQNLDNHDSGETSLEMTLGIALTAAMENPKNKSATDVLSDELNSIFGMAGEQADRVSNKDFFWRFYVAYFYKLSQSGNTPAFARLISLTAYHDDNIQWFKDNPDKLKSLKDWMSNTSWDTGN